MADVKEGDLSALSREEITKLLAVHGGGLNGDRLDTNAWGRATMSTDYAGKIC